MASSDDSSLALAARSDPQAFAALYDQYVVRLYAYALRQTGSPTQAQDVTSATFEKALRYLRHRDWKKGSFLAWLYRIARNEAINQYRKSSRLVDLTDYAAIAQDQEATLETDQEKLQLRSAFSRLPTRDQEVLNLRFIDGLSSVDAAEILGCTLPKLYLQVHRALQRLRKELESEVGIEKKEATDSAKNGR